VKQSALEQDEREMLAGACCEIDSEKVVIRSFEHSSNIRE